MSIRVQRVAVTPLTLLSILERARAALDVGEPMIGRAFVDDAIQRLEGAKICPGCGARRRGAHAGATRNIVGQPVIRRILPEHRIEANAVADGDRWNCDVMVRRTLSQDTPHRDRVMCSKVTPALAEQAGALWARRWIDYQLPARG